MKQSKERLSLQKDKKNDCPKRGNEESDDNEM